MSTNSTSDSVSTKSAQVRQTVSTRFSPLLHNGDSFRLLRVLPSLSHGFSIRCELYTSSISRERDKYIAGSYVWGPPEPRMTILVDGEHFQVRENLFRFLRAFRSRYHSQVIWLDAICINQDDVQERSHQVQEMKRIYSGAKCVYSWLGDKPLPHTGIFNRQYIIDLYHRYRKDERQHTRQRHQLEQISQAEYWSRMWIVQEFLLAQDVHLLLGRHKLSYNKLEEIMRDVALTDPWTKAMQVKNKIFALTRHRGVRRTFEELFEIFGMLPRSVPLDGVFALLGLLWDREEELRLISIADYSLTVWQLLQQILALDILESPFKFAEQYNRYVIKGQRDDYMGGHVGMELMESPPRQLSAHDNRHARTEGSSLEVAIAMQKCKAIWYHEEIDADTIEVAVYTPRWRTIYGQSGVSVGLSWYVETPMNLDSVCTDVLVEACDSRCATTCATHAVVGFLWKFTQSAGQIRCPKSTASINVPLFAYYASGDVSQLIHNIQQRSTETIEAISSKVRMTANGRFTGYKNQTPYKLETDVETIVTLSTFIKSLETDKGWRGLLKLAMDSIPKPETEEDAKRPKKRRRRRKHVSQKRGETRAD